MVVLCTRSGGVGLTGVWGAGADRPSNLLLFMTQRQIFSLHPNVGVVGRCCVEDVTMISFEVSSGALWCCT